MSFFALALKTLVKLLKQRVETVHALESITQSCQCKTLLKQPKTKKAVSEFNQDSLSSPCCSSA